MILISSLNIMSSTVGTICLFWIDRIVKGKLLIKNTIVNRHFSFELLQRCRRSSELQACIFSLTKRISCWISFFDFNGRLCRPSFPSAKLFAENAFKNHVSLVELGRNNLAFLSERGILGIGS